MLGGADNPNGELPSYITGADNLKETTCWVERTIQMVNYRLISLALTDMDDGWLAAV
ncbi:hypothetical protein O5626_24035 [Escherichia coli]|nr:hypothetical protein [Escherichia coli]